LAVFGSDKWRQPRTRACRYPKNSNSTSSHDLADVERLCDRLLIIDRGRVIENGTVEAVKHRDGARRTLVVDIDAPSSGSELRM
jgi:ABC-type uncharacterized transport system ATPase subunit